MSRRYDSRTTTFSPDGHLLQVEYAIGSTDNAGAVIGILAPAAPPEEEKKDGKKDGKEDIAMEGETSKAAAASSSTAKDNTTEGTSSSTSSRRPGVVLIAEKRVKSKLLDKQVGGAREKIFDINENIVVGVAGVTSDASSVVSHARNYAQDHLFNYNEDMPVERLVKQVCNLKQGYTLYGGLRPFGVAFLYAGYDPLYNFQLYASDPSGNFSGWKATAVGGNNSTGKSILQEEYKEQFGVDEGLELAIKALLKTLDATSLDPQAVEISTVTLDPNTQKPKVHLYTEAEMSALFDKQGVLRKDDDNTAMNL